MKSICTFLALLLLVTPAYSQQVRIGVLGLFHPRDLTITAAPGSALLVQAGRQSMVLETSSGADSTQLRISGGQVAVTTNGHQFRALTVAVTSRTNGLTDFLLAIPGKISRHYHGTLEVKLDSGALAPVVTMDLETAVASVVASESVTGDPIEALKAQAVATRSYLIAGKGRHHGFDFCDTTHCQFLREPPAPNSAANRATEATRGLVLAFQSQPFTAMYTRSCAGRTHTPRDLGMLSAAYPYYSVECKYCREHPARWERRLTAKAAEQLRSSNEAARLEINRRLGWNTVPSNDFTVQKEGDQLVLRGAGMGHGIGLCQAGAKAMARQGAGFREILTYYYPNSIVGNLP